MYKTEITAALLSFVDGWLAKSPDAKHNTGRQLSSAFVWDTIAKVAKSRSDGYWKEMEAKGGVLGSTIQEMNLGPGDHIVANSPSFDLRVKISNPVRRFTPQVLAERLHKKYKIAIPTALQMIEDAKVPGTSNVIAAIVEKADAG